MRGALGVGCLLICLLVMGCGDDCQRRSASGTGGVGGGNGGEGGDGGASGQGGAAGVGGNGGSEPSACEPGSPRDCYTGPPGTANIGACVVGVETCNEEGTAFGPCENEVVPSMELPTPPGGTPVDEDCDGMTDEV